MNILEKYQLLHKARQKRIGGLFWGVATRGELEMGEEFEFATSDEPALSDEIDLRTGRFPNGRFYGKAKIVKTDGLGWCVAKRIS